MKIAVLGYSGSGKSTLAKKLGDKYGVPVLHLDTVQFLPGWQVRPAEEKVKIVCDFLDENGSWVVDGNYTKLSYERRLQEADLIIILSFNRISSFIRAYKRSRAYKNKTRPDMAEGCNEKFDPEFMKWILYGGRTKEARRRYKDIALKYSKKTVVLKNQRDIDRFEKEYGL